MPNAYKKFKDDDSSPVTTTSQYQNVYSCDNPVYCDTDSVEVQLPNPSTASLPDPIFSEEQSKYVSNISQEQNKHACVVSVEQTKPSCDVTTEQSSRLSFPIHLVCDNYCFGIVK